MPGVARPRAGLSGAAILIGAVLAGLLLFSILDARRRALSAPAVRPARSDLLGVSQAPPPLYIPSVPRSVRSEEHTSELQSLMRISYAVFCLKKKKNSNMNDNRK